MPTPAIITSAAANYQFNSDFLAKTVEDLSPDEWLKSPASNMNHVAWIVGHCIWARKRLLDRLKAEWAQQELSTFARGNKLPDTSEIPAPDDLLKSWRESAAILSSTLNSVTEDFLAQPAPPGPPSPDGKISGIVNFLAIHETYHIGQASYLRSWLGHKGLMG
jgi:uncharacterized damage-inducible protein DinB